MHAHCYRSGEIELSRKADLDGAIWIGEGRMGDLKTRIMETARLAYDGVTWLVPGIPEAATDAEAEAAMLAYRARLTAPHQ